MTEVPQVLRKARDLLDKWNRAMEAHAQRQMFIQYLDGIWEDYFGEGPMGRLI